MSLALLLSSMSSGVFSVISLPLRCMNYSFGVARARKEIGEDALLGIMAIVPFDGAAARRAAHLHDALIRHNQDIGIKDVLIAACCLEQSLALLTANERHFSRVPQLTVITPEALLL